MSQEVIEKVVIRNRLGLHARPAMSFVDLAGTFQATITVRRLGEDAPEEVDGKSIMQMMMLAATQGTELEILADGPDATPAVEALSQLIADKFGED